MNSHMYVCLYVCMYESSVARVGSALLIQQQMLNHQTE
jgi:hypothetical protein